MNQQLKFIAAFLILILLFPAISATDNSIVLSMQDMNNRSIQQAKIQSPFILQLELNNKDLIDNDVKYISGMDSFKHSPAMRHSHVSTDDNGKTIHKIIYRFVLQSEKKGTYTIGPCLLKDKTGKFIKSNRLIIVVADEIVLSDKVEAPKYMVQCKCEQKKIYVGEKTSLQLQFFDRIFVDNPTVELPEFENLHVLSIEKNKEITLVHRDGYDYAVTQWSVNFYPTQLGTFIIDGIKVTFLDQRLEEKSLAKGVFRRFGSMMKVDRELYVHPVSLQVVDLPKKQGCSHVTAVGQFSKLVISVNKKSIEQGLGLVVTTELFGDGNFEMMDSVPLILPHGFQSYNADTMVIDRSRTCRHSEFIVQAQEPGVYRIAPQKIKYFDPADAQYKTIQSNSLDITITANPFIQNIKDQELQQQSDKHELHDIHDKKNIADYIILEPGILPGILLAPSPRMLPVQWYTCMIYFLLCMLFMMMMYRYMVEQYIFPHERWQHFIIFLRAKKACKYAAHKHDAAMLYAIFIDLFVTLKIGNSGIINEEFIEHYLKKIDFSDEQIVQWRKFYSRLLRASFAHDDQLDATVLFQESLVWLQQLKEKT